MVLISSAAIKAPISRPLVMPSFWLAGSIGD